MSSISPTAIRRPASVSRSSASPTTARPSCVAELETDADGRIRDLLDGAELAEGDYQLAFDVGGYADDPDAFFQSVAVALRVTDAGRSYHVPLLLSPFGMSTYRGS